MNTRNDSKSPGKIHITCIHANHSTSTESIDIKSVKQAFNDTGIVLIRGFDFDHSSFEDFTQEVCDKFIDIGVRHELKETQGDGYSTKVSENNFTLLAHTEETFRPLLGYDNGTRIILPAPPEVCSFMCITPPTVSGGETTIVDGAAFLEQMPTGMRERFEKVGIIYSMSWGPERWRNEFLVENSDALIKLLDRIPGVRYDFQDEILNLYYSTDAVTISSRGKRAFAVGILAHLPCITHSKYQSKKAYVEPSNHVYYGDGEEITDKTINKLIDIHDSLIHLHQWTARDVLLIDNTRYLHGRTMTSRPCKRSIISRFGWLKTQAASIQ